MGIKTKLSLIRKYFGDKPVEFAETMLKFNPFPYQEKFLEDQSKRIIFLSGRQVGKSTVTSIKALWYAWTHDESLVIIVATRKDQAKLIVDKISAWIDKNILLRYGTSTTTYEVRFNNGSKILALPNKADAVRGYTADIVIVDEASYIDEDVFTAIEPTLLYKDGTLILLGTPANRSGRFWEAWNSENWSKHHATSMDNPINANSTWLEEFKKSRTDADWHREIMGEFITDESLFFDLDSVRECAVGREYKRPQTGFTYYAGLDVARTNDDTCLALIGIHDETGKIELHKYYINSKSTIPQTARWVFNIIQKWKPVMLVVDTNGIGVSVYDMLSEKINEHDLSTELVGHQMSKVKRMEVYNALKQAIESNEITLIKDEMLVSQFTSFKVNIHKDGRIEVSKERYMKDDIVDALGLAVYGYYSGAGNWELLDFMDLDRIFRADYHIDFGGKEK